MISYDPKSPWILAKIQGSIFPQAMSVAGPAALITLIFKLVILETPDIADAVSTFVSKQGVQVGQVWQGFNFVLGFLVVFRTQQAYGRYWEGMSLLSKMRAEWFTACSGVFAFCSDKPELSQEKKSFEHKLVRLISMAYCSALQQVSTQEEESMYQTINASGMDTASYIYLEKFEDHEKVMVLVQWIQKLMIQAVRTGIIEAAPPLVTRSFQDLTRGVVNFVDARRITEVQFPFPYAQMQQLLLTMQLVFTPIISGLLVESPPMAVLLCFLSVFSFWGLHMIAMEIELPFGDDQNDLPVKEMMDEFNRSLLLLLETRCNPVPTFNEATFSDSFKQTKEEHDTGVDRYSKHLCRWEDARHHAFDSWRSAGHDEEPDYFDMSWEEMQAEAHKKRGWGRAVAGKKKPEKGAAALVAVSKQASLAGGGKGSVDGAGAALLAMKTKPDGTGGTPGTADTPAEKGGGMDSE
eukprot:TRINITY_DN19650_c0_g1_i1.p1 TRINITY_DN19650_c0_g1~~TRINITY_DN19650_c0_g1_i1.p1  ORF type:complete len:465 (-),score=159.19 TRINITY_DN19650_c0_g1_i1:90-1484(-)